MDVFDEINAGLAKHGAEVLAQSQTVIQNEIVNIPPVVADPPPTQDNNSSLNNPPVVVDPPPVTNPPPVTDQPPAPVKSFDELLAERTEGKFKSFDELKTILEAPPKDEFANEQIKLINELAKNGVKMDAEYFRFTGQDFANEIDPEKIFAESLRLKEPGITQKEIDWEFKQKYRTDEWSDEGQDPTEVEEALAPKMLRDIEQMKADLIKRQQDLSIVPKSDSAVVNETNAKMQALWEENTDDVATKLPKLSYKIQDNSDKALTHDFEFNLTEKENKPVIDLVKQMGVSNRVFFDRFKGEDGKFSLPKMYEALVKLENFDTAVKASYQAGMAKGGLKEISGIKNIQFNTDGSPVAQQAPSNAKAMRESLEKELGL